MKNGQNYHKTYKENQGNFSIICGYEVTYAELKNL